MDAKDQALENLRLENEKLRREVEYQKLKVAGLLQAQTQDFLASWK